MSDRNDRIAGVLLAQACGDALGSHYEFGPPSYGHAQMLRGTFGHAPGAYTDDSEQAVCVALARSEPQQVAANLLGWYRANPKDVGHQTSAVMSRARTPRGLAMASRAYAARTEARPKPAGWDPGTGNGSLMRTGPVALPYLGDRDKIAAAARAVSGLTHADAWACDASVLWSLVVDAAISAGDGTNAHSADVGRLVRAGLWHVPEERQEFWYQLIRSAASPSPERRRRNGSAVGCFIAALHACSHSTSLEDGLQRAVSYGNDTDTVGAVAGALLGAICGASAVPDQWRSAVHGWPDGMDAAGLEALALRAAGVPAQVTA